jgi:hypothetical protein
MKVADVDFIEKFFAEGKEYIEKDDPVQASEKLYKVVEECIKLLAEKENLPEHEEFKKEGRWWSRLLARTASTLAQRLGEDGIGDAWARAFNLHIWGFHEKALGIEHITPDIPYVEWLVNYTKAKVDGFDINSKNSDSTKK